MFNREKRRERKLYQKRLGEVRERFESIMRAPVLRNFVDEGGTIIISRLELWGIAFLIDETVALKTLTKVLIVLSIVLGVLTFVLAYSTVVAFFAWISRA